MTNPMVVKLFQSERYSSRLCFQTIFAKISGRVGRVGYPNHRVKFGALDTSNMYTYLPNNVLAQKIRKYYTEERGTVHIPPPKGCKIIPVKKIVPMVPNINKKELAEANGIEECSDILDDYGEENDNLFIGT